MDEWVIEGGRPLAGSVHITGAKNAVLPVLAATMLYEQPIVIDNVPDLLDTQNMLAILEHLGGKVARQGRRLHIDTAEAACWSMPEWLAKEVRSSIFMLGPILGRFRQAVVTYPGGCDIGLRPIDLHLAGLRALGVRISEHGGHIYCDGSAMRGGVVHLDFPSVGATENIMMAAAFIPGSTVLENAAKEPEIVELQQFLRSIGANVQGAGSSTIYIEGETARQQRFDPVHHSVMPDRIVAGTYMVAAAITGGDITVEQVVPEHLTAITVKLREAGCDVIVGKDSIRVRCNRRPQAVHLIETQPYPGFPTDMQAQMMTLCALSEGTSVLVENIFESRYKHVPELVRMGAQIMVKDRMAVVRGVPHLMGAHLQAHDLRGGAALALAALAAEGTSVLSGTHLVARGYERMDEVLAALGGSVQPCGI
nr:UDP-N-acetylglucosamine 1-carboxyvinyltransferase [Maliibacterium massiliense]